MPRVEPAPGPRGRVNVDRRHFARLFGRSPEERTVGYSAAWVFGLMMLLAALLMSGILRQQVNRTSTDLLVRLLDEHLGYFQQALDQAGGRVENVVLSRPYLRKLLRERRNGRAAPGDLQKLEGLLANIAQDRQVTAIALHDASGRLLAARGRFVTDVPISVPIADSPESRLSWHEGYVLQAAAAIVEQDTLLGTVRMDVRLMDTGKRLVHAGLGETGEMLLCARAESARAMKCFPSRFAAQGYTGPREVDGRFLPMHYALEGRQGVIEALDYRGHEVLNAFASIGASGLGMAVKMDVAELHRPFMKDAPWLAALLAVFLAGGVLMLRWRLSPLIREMVNAHGRVKAVIENAPEAIVTLDARGAVQEGNQAVCAMFGYACDELAGRHVSVLMPEPPHGQYDSHLQHGLRTDGPCVTGPAGRQMEGLRKDGTRIAIELLVAEVPAEGERRFIGFMRDVTERERMEHDIRESRERYRALIETTSDWVWEMDENLVYTYASPGCRRMLGYEPAQLIGKSPFDLMPEGEAERVRNLLSEFKAGACYKIENMNLGSDGRPVMLETSAVPVFDGEGMFRGYRGIGRDITERRRREQELQQSHDEVTAACRRLEETQSQLLQSEKMASIGQVAAGVAHEINNPIGYVFSNLGSLDGYLKDLLSVIDTYEGVEAAISDVASLARVKQAKDAADLGFIKKDVQDLMSECREGITRVKKIVQDLKDFSRVDSSDEWQWADLHKGIDSTLNIVGNELKYKAKVVKEYGDLPEVECLPSQLNQVFLNMLVNAGHAIEAFGTITIRSGTGGGQVWVEVEDTGKGIAPAHLERIFDPFFTTKPVGAGTGLGLSLSYGIVKRHHGEIDVTSEPGKGTRFRVRLPVTQQKNLEAESPHPA